MMRCQLVKIKSLPEEIESFYNLIQDDYKKVMKFLVEESGLGYLVWQDDVATIVEPKTSSLNEIISILSNGGKLAENCYGLFFNGYKPLKNITKKSKEYKFSCVMGDEEHFNKNVKRMDCFSIEDWTIYRNRIVGGENVDVVWEEIADRIGNKKGSLVVCNKHLFPKVHLPNNKAYCTALISMVASAFSSWIECHKNHVDGTLELEEKLNTKIKECPSVYQDLLALSKALENSNYGLSRRVLKTILQLAREGIEPETFFAIPFEEINKPQYKALLDSDDKVIFAAYNALKLYWRLFTRKKYISMPRLKDYQVPFGLSGRGMSFELRVKKGAVVAKINNHDIVCLPSYYFNDLEITKVDNAFFIKFRNKLKDKKKDVCKQWMEAYVKEIKILKKDGDFYLYLPYSFEREDDYNFELENYFMCADPKPIEIKQVKLAGFDLNLSTPIAATHANWNGEIDTQTTTSTIVCHDTSLSKRLQCLTNDMRELTQVIRNYKTSVKNSVELNEESVDWLSKQLGTTPYGNYRHQIQLVMASLNKEKRKCWHKCRKNGHNNLSESVRLLQAMDAAISMSHSYNNLHVFNREDCIYGFTNDKRKNFRDFVSKQFGAIIALYCSNNAINVAFIEDLEIKTDYDNDNNSLTRLFAAGQLKQSIEYALEKIGVGCVFVAPAGTSRTDPITGMPGYRDKFNKTSLFVFRDGKIGKLHSDLAASLNVLLQGLSHSVFPYKFWVKKGKVSKNGKRITVFLTKRSFSGFNDYSGWIYPNPDGFLTTKQKEDLVEEIKHQSLRNANVIDFAITGAEVKSYNAFRMQ